MDSPDLLLLLHQGLKLGPTWDGQVEGFGSEERLQIEQIEVIFIHQICQQLVAKAIEGGHDLQGEVPVVVGGAVHQPVWEGGDPVYQVPNHCLRCSLASLWYVQCKGLRVRAPTHPVPTRALCS